jgi:hypothetical protein
MTAADELAEAPIDASLAAKLYAELIRACRCEMAWVMNLGWYKRLRRNRHAYKPDDVENEDEWVPGIDDRLFGQRILVREDGGQPHIEWLTREEMGL